MQIEERDAPSQSQRNFLNSQPDSLMHSLLTSNPEAINFRNYQVEKEIKFYMLFNNLEQFLTELTQEKKDDSNNMKPIELGSKEFFEKAKAKEYFTNSAHEIILAIRNALEVDGVFNFLPICFFDRLVRGTKQELVKNYEKILESINNQKEERRRKERQRPKTLSENDSTESKRDETIKMADGATQRTNRKGKAKISKRAIAIMKNWFNEHLNDPYPSHNEKLKISKEAGITMKQVQIWFTNNRGRVWRKTYKTERFANKVEEKLKENESKFGAPSTN